MDRFEFIKEFENYLKNKRINNEDEFNRYLEEFMEQSDIDPSMFESDFLDESEAESADDFLELAQEAENISDALKYAKKAASIDPENWDVAVMVADLSAKSFETLLGKYEKIIEKANAAMKRDNWFDKEYVGYFWGIFETRPYMRLRHVYFTALIKCSMLKKAIAEGEDIIRLNESDNLGVRYVLMHLYTYFEDSEKALALYEKYDEESTMFLLTLSILYYRLGDLKKSEQYLKKLKEQNKDTLRFFKYLLSEDMEKMLDREFAYGYSPFSIEELAVEFKNNMFLFSTMPSYIEWGHKKLKSMK